MRTQRQEETGGMDGSRFDALARTLSAPNSRRRVLGLLTAMPILGGLAGVLHQVDAAAKNRRRRRKQRHKKRKNPGSRNKRQAKKHTKPRSHQPARRPETA